MERVQVVPCASLTYILVIQIFFLPIRHFSFFSWGYSGYLRQFNLYFGYPKVVFRTNQAFFPFSPGATVVTRVSLKFNLYFGYPKVFLDQSGIFPFSPGATVVTFVSLTYILVIQFFFWTNQAFFLFLLGLQWLLASV